MARRGISVEQRTFWIGFTWGAATAVSGALIAGGLGRGGSSRVLRLEKSVQIACSPQEAFAAWSDFEQLPTMIKTLESVTSIGGRSHWNARFKGAPVEWQAELTQLIPDQAIGWKSVSGPKHSGRITFSSLGRDTLVHVQMNYAPPSPLLRSALVPFTDNLESYIEQGLRDLKAYLENLPTSPTTERSRQDALGRATGTYGPGPELVAEQHNRKFGAPSTPVEYTAPPEAKR